MVTSRLHPIWPIVAIAAALWPVIGYCASPAKNPGQFALKRLEMAYFSVDLPVEFVDRLQIRVTNGDQEQASRLGLLSAANTDPVPRWMWGTLSRDRGRWPEQEMKSNYDQCPDMAGEVLRVLNRRVIRLPGAEGTQSLCGLKGGRMKLDVYLNSKRRDVRYLMEFYFEGKTYNKSFQGFVNRVVDSFQEKPGN